MQAYYLSRPLHLRTRIQSKDLNASRIKDSPTGSEVYIAAQNEISLIENALGLMYPQAPTAEYLNVIPPENALKLPGLPPMLGALAYPQPAEAPPGSLLEQLRQLRAAQPERQHFRLLLINGFGSNLGDNLIGLTAFRQMLSVCRAELPEVSVDVLLGWHGDDRLERQFRNVDGVARIFTQGITLAELGAYQGYYDTSDLVNLPGYGKEPLVDWYLGLLGVDADSVAAEEKRNRIEITAEASARMETLLPASRGPRLLINPKASVGLRSMPPEATRRLVETLLATWPEAQILLLQPLPLEDPRVVQLAGAIPDIDQLAALTAAVDGVVSVDTYTTHLADATSTPAVTLYSTFSPEVFPYYPLVAGLAIPGAEQLPAWGKPKIKPQEWVGFASEYYAAWRALDMATVVANLQRMMEKKAAGPESYRLHAMTATPREEHGLTRMIMRNGVALEVPGRRSADPVAELFVQAIAEAAKEFIVPGDTVVMAGPGAGECALDVAAMVGQHGYLVLLEPRRRLHQLLCANLARANIWHAETHCVLPEGKGIARREMPSLQLHAEARPLAFSNSAQHEPVLCWPLDSLALTSCRLLVLCSPLARAAVLEGAIATLEQLRPVVLVGVIAKTELDAFAPFFKALHYQTRMLEMGTGTSSRQGAVYGIFLAEPEEQCANPAGIAPA